MQAHDRLEGYAEEFVSLFGVKEPPVPIDDMLQYPPDDMWEKVDVTRLSGTFLAITDPYSPRMSLARMLVRHLASSEWGERRNLPALLHENPDNLRAMARMLLMPRKLVLDASDGELNPTTMSMIFQVPEEDARLRLEELDQA
jgi:hypothetical protein